MRLYPPLPIPHLLIPKKTTQSPKETAMRLQSAVVPPRISIVKLKWTAPSGRVNPGIVFAFGSQPLAWTNSSSVGAVTNYTLSITNWSEGGIRHFFTVWAVDNTLDTANIFPYPQYPSDQVRISWMTNWNSATILTAQTLFGPWTALATVIGTNQFSTSIISGTHFFRLLAPGHDMLTITPYNHLN